MSYSPTNTGYREEEQAVVCKDQSLFVPINYTSMGVTSVLSRNDTAGSQGMLIREEGDLSVTWETPFCPAGVPTA